MGLRSDYLSPTIYLTDVLIWWLLIFILLRWLLRRLYSPTAVSLPPSLKSYLTLGAGLVAVALISIGYSVNPATGWWHLEKLIEFILFGGLVSWALANPLWRRQILMGFLLGMMLQALLALAQFGLGHSLGLWIMGERSFDVNTLGVARAEIDGRLVLRGYGTFSHPNVLSMGLVVASTLSTYFAVVNRDYLTKLFFSILTILFGLAVLTTLSRVEILLWLISSSCLVIWAVRYSLSKLSINIFTLMAIFAVLLAGVWFGPTELSRFQSLGDIDTVTFTQRLQLNQIAAQLWQAHPFTGVGLGSFVNYLTPPPRISDVPFVQPVHNLYLLVATEIGIIGLVFVVTLLALGCYRALVRRQYLLLLITLEIAVAGLFDHYFWSLQQGGLLWWSIVGGLFSQMVEPEVIPGRQQRQRS